MLPYENYVELMKELDELVSAFENHPDENTRDAAMALLNGLDLLHREGLQRLLAAVRDRQGDEPLDEGVEEDPVVRAFLGLYDLAELDVPEEPAPGETAASTPDPADGDDPAAPSPDAGSGSDPRTAPGSAGPPPTGFVPLSRLRYRRKGERRNEPGSAGGPSGGEDG